MFSVVYNGILIGLGLSVMIGPIFFALIQTAIERGVKNAIYLALGISLSDLFYILLVYFGLHEFMSSPTMHTYLGIGGGIILIIFGIQNFFKKNKLHQESVLVESKRVYKTILKGFLLNSLHPGVVVFWFASVGGMLAKSDHTEIQTLILFSVAVLTNFLMDLLKIKLSKIMSKYLTLKMMKILNYSVGAILIICGGVLLYSTFQKV